MIFLHLESFETSVSKYFRNRVFTVKPPQEGKFCLHGHDIFFQDSCSFPYTKKLMKVSDHFVEKIQHELTTLSIDGCWEMKMWLDQKLIQICGRLGFW